MNASLSEIKTKFSKYVESVCKEEELTPHEMEVELLNIGYSGEYLDTLHDDALKRLYLEEFQEE